MDKQKIFYYFLTVILCVIALNLTLKLVFKTDQINQGKFRVTDAVLLSEVQLTDKTSTEKGWCINVSQRNRLTFLITPMSSAQVKRVYINDLKVKGGQDIVFYIKDDETRLILNSFPQSLDVEHIIDDNGQIKIDLIALNENVLKNWVVPEHIKEIRCDGKIFQTAGVSLNTIKFDLMFKLNIEEENGKISTLEVDMTLPNDRLEENGVDVIKLPTNQFKFKVN